MECRICFATENTSNNPLITPCDCKGTLKYVHKNCLQHWREDDEDEERAAFNMCLVCKREYKIKKKETFYIPSYFIKIIQGGAQYILLHLIGFSVAIISRYMDLSSNYLLYFIEDFKKPSQKIVKFFNKYQLSAIAYYYSVFIFLMTILAYLTLFSILNRNINYHSKYWSKMGFNFLINMIYACHFVICLIFVKKEVFEWINIDMILSSFNLFIFSYLLVDHNIIIDNDKDEVINLN